jgi:O-antigen/teichoic acid export membrane protein
MIKVSLMSLHRNTAWNIAGNVLPLLVGAATIPFLLKQIGMERFGILTLLWTIIGYFSLFDFGVGRALTQQIAACRNNSRVVEIPQIMKVGLEFTVITGIVGAVILSLSAFPLSHYGLGISPSLRQETFISLLIAAVGIPMATCTTGLRGCLEAFENFRLSNFARTFLGVSLFLAPAISVVLHGNSLVMMTLWLLLARALSLVLSFWYVMKLSLGRFWVTKVDNPNVRKNLMSFGLWMTVTNLVSPLLVSLDRFVLSFLLGASVIAYYTLPFEFLVRLLIIPGAVGASLLPSLAKEYSIQSTTAHATMITVCKQIAIIMAILCIGAASLCYPLMNFFISTDFASKAWLIVVILSVGVFINGLAYIPYTALHAKGNAKPTGILHLSELIIYVPVLLVFVHFAGLHGAAIAWTLRTTFDCIAMFIIYLKQK